LSDGEEIRFRINGENAEFAEDAEKNTSEHRLKPVLPVKFDETGMAFRGV
jgi:hypothetical protein